jgi:hypothetical protein
VWRDASAATGGRVLAKGLRHDTRVFFEAADVYIDSFPFSSNTSLLEAGGFGLPLISYFPHSAESLVLGAGAPGIDAPLRKVTDFSGFERALHELIADPVLRERLGDTTRRTIEQLHCGEGWRHNLSELMTSVGRSQRQCRSEITVANSHTELDVLLHRFYSRHVSIEWALSWYAIELSYISRLALLHRIRKIDRSFSRSLFLPTWAGKLLRKTVLALRAVKAAL